MTRAARGLDLGDAGERKWSELEAAFSLYEEAARSAKGAGTERALVVADSYDLRGELRRRFESLGPLRRLQPGPALIDELRALADPAAPIIAWVEASATGNWDSVLAALNASRDQMGPLFLVLAGDRRLRDRLAAKAPDLSHVLGPIVTLDDEPDIIAPLCWMHLSDLHINETDWEQDEVLDGLLRDLRGLLEGVERSPQLLFVSGDVAYSGRQREYERARAFLTELMNTLELEPEHVFLVPGNHDVDRRARPPSVRRDHERLLQLGDDEFRRAVGELLGSPEELRRYAKRMEQWCAFTAALLGDERGVEITRPWRADFVRISGVTVGVASICSAWTSGANDEEGKLIVGMRQLRELGRELERSQAELKVALLHHPLRSLTSREEGDIDALLTRDFDLVLHGHQHRRQSRLDHRGADAAMWMGAGAAYAGLGQDRWHGFFVGQWDVERGELDVDAFTWSTNDGGLWHTDTSFGEAGMSARRRWEGRRPRGFAGRAATPTSDPIDDLAARIRAAVRAEPAHLNFIGFPPDIGSSPRIERSRVFVAPIVSRRAPEAQDEFEALVARCIAPRIEDRPAVILGEPGSGKSTLCRVLAQDVARSDRGPAPLQLRLRELRADDHGEALLELVARQLRRRNHVDVDADTLARLCTDGRALLLVDGLDEAGPSREQLGEQLHDFAGVYPSSPLLITSREADYASARLDPERFDELQLEPFDDPRLRTFVDQWYAIVIPDDRDARDRARASLRAALEAQPQARALARNPLLATLVALVHHASATGELPARRTELYRVCVELLVRDWPEKWNRAMGELSGDWQLGQLELLALWMQESRGESKAEGGILVDGPILDETLEKLLEHHADPRVAAQRRGLAGRWRRWLVASKVLQVQQGRLHGFVHLSLMEYLAARRLYDKLGKDPDRIAEFIVGHRFKANWRETFLLMLERRADDRDLCARVLRALVDRATHEREATFLLAALREELSIDDTLRADLLSAVANIVSQWTLRPRHMGHAALVANIIQSSEKHGAAVERWLIEQARRQIGRALVGALLMAPPSVPLEPELDRRALSPHDMTMLLELGEEEPWGRWALARATGRELLAESENKR